MAIAKEIINLNPEKNISIILYSFRSHHLKLVAETIGLLDITLAFIPAYTPDLNPMESSWTSVKRILPVALINPEEDLRGRIRESFLWLAASQAFAKSWKWKFMNESIMEQAINHN